MRQLRHPSLDRIVELDLVFVDELHEQRAQVRERDGAVAEVHRCGRRHAVHRFAKRLADHDLVALRDLNDDRAEMLGLHRFLNDVCDGRRLIQLRCLRCRLKAQTKAEGRRKKEEASMESKN